MADFSVSVRSFVDKARDRARASFRGIAAEVVSEIQEKTPVRTGYLRANFSAITKDEAIPVPGSPSMSAITKAELDDTILIVNPVAYARSVEYGYNGTTKDGKEVHRQGRGMVQQTVAEVPEIAERVVAELTK